MTDTEHRPTLSPEFVGRLAASMDSLRQAWEADVTELRATKAKLHETEAQLALTKERLADIAEDFRELRAENFRVIQENARLNAKVELLIQTSRDAGDHLSALAARAEIAGATASAPDPVIAPADDDIEFAERANRQRRAACGKSAVEDDGRSLDVDDLPVFIREAQDRHRTHLAPNLFGRPV